MGPRARVITLLIVLLVLAAACSNESKAAATKTPARQWARQVCVAVLPMKAEIGRLQQNVSGKITATTDPATTKRELVTLFGSGAELAEHAWREVTKAGIPDVADGDKIATTFGGALETTQRSFARGQSEIEKLPTDDATAFSNGIVATFTEMNAEMEGSSLEFSSLASAELDKAFNELPECQV